MAFGTFSFEGAEAKQRQVIQNPILIVLFDFYSKKFKLKYKFNLNGDEPDISFDIIDVEADKENAEQKNETNPEVEPIKENTETNETTSEEKTNSSDISVSEVSESHFYLLKNNYISILLIIWSQTMSRSMEAKIFLDTSHSKSENLFTSSTSWRAIRRRPVKRHSTRMVWSMESTRTPIRRSKPKLWWVSSFPSLMFVWPPILFTLIDNSLKWLIVYQW